MWICRGQRAAVPPLLGRVSRGARRVGARGPCEASPCHLTSPTRLLAALEDTLPRRGGDHAGPLPRRAGVPGRRAGCSRRRGRVRARRRGRRVARDRGDSRRRCASLRTLTSPASRRAFRCLDADGWGICVARSISPAERSPPRSISTILRRVGSARAARAASMRLYSQSDICGQGNIRLSWPLGRAPRWPRRHSRRCGLRRSRLRDRGVRARPGRRGIPGAQGRIRNPRPGIL